jgi:glycosyltransferase XagB
VKLVVEACDDDTLAVLRQLRLPPWCEIIVAPPGVPRTKPRALNVALPFCRGDLVAIFDAEDEPDPSQLRLAAATFARGTPDLVCLQARLCIDNAGDGWLAALFALEYAALFDVVNPGFAALGQAFPLGGTSNHFRAEALRQAYAWDAWNVTEDADLGVRLARRRARIGVIASCTSEEAPARLRAWRLQRQRWIKGWMQTLITHTRHPLRLARECGPGEACGLCIVLCGAILGALFGPLLFGVTLWRILFGDLGVSNTSLSLEQFASLHLFWTGVVACLAPILVGAWRRGLWAELSRLYALPAYYGLMSVAAWGALVELIAKPHHWHKTEHGLAKTSRKARLERGRCPAERCAGPVDSAPA